MCVLPENCNPTHCDAQCAYAYIKDKIYLTTRFPVCKYYLKKSIFWYDFVHKKIKIVYMLLHLAATVCLNYKKYWRKNTMHTEIISFVNKLD